MYFIMFIVTSIVSVENNHLWDKYVVKGPHIEKNKVLFVLLYAC